VVLAHLEQPLVAQATRLLRSAIWGGRTPLHRLAAVRVTLPEEADIDGVLVAVFARLVIVGADGGRLHEEIMLAARAVPGSGRSRRLELEQPRYSRLREAVEGALEPDASRVARRRQGKTWWPTGRSWSRCSLRTCRPGPENGSSRCSEP